jgi:hypothetical protein
MFNWLRKAWGATKHILGKVKTGVESGAKIFNKGKQMYTSVKDFASNLPVVGAVAKEMIGKAEGQVNQYAKDKIGVDFKDINKAVSTAEGVAKYLPSSR